MSSKTKIVVLHRKEVALAAVFLAAALGILLLLFAIYGPWKKSGADRDAALAQDAAYIPGVYTSSIELNSNTFDVQVTVDQNKITDISLVNLSESTTAMYPLMEPALEDLASQIYSSQSFDNITYSDDNKYTSMLLLNAIETAAEKARR